ncbi:hypothetical protein PN419_09390 [Halorubrum ezzemoulense]|jgi:hypothetical protein|uniref:Uncharacterized protein n=1 Tax=Halorubrum ezzemoulense TaxID=337243 RepID=A0A238Y093_HALEZ|nr:MULTISPECIES: hypothetical protein [Halorubrum]MDB2224465.1 hypothetical protein [Halorubrum ezzemoulense]MDB2242859.1 hypothetical protein [Halorubrum ezzemoulense]MDB2245768.1 hypothetical protein [Halorubrum ezzemoulense]MDB2252966.1 hypothetical protein [Halorubrum ezzemoulense]MDB2264759.1 hypothetical protein [Halorubrum ezzemoulense]
MRKSGRVFLAGVAAAGVAVGLLLLVGAPTSLVPTGALGAAIPVALTYAVMTAADDDAQ